MEFGKVAVIGASVSGLSLALFLKRNGFDISVYELRASTPHSDGANAITLSPNGLKVLNVLGSNVVERICSKGYHFNDLTFRSSDHERLDSYEVGNEQKYGFAACRVYRQVILDELGKLVAEAGIPVLHGKKFLKVISESEGSVRFAFEGGTEATAGLLVGADGIHSKVRRHILPDIEPVWSGAVALSCVTNTAEIEFPFDEYRRQLPASIHGPTGAVHMAPQNWPGTETAIVVQWITEERSRDGWQKLENDKSTLRKTIENIGGFNDVTRSGIAAANDDTFAIWPFYTVSRLPNWYSEEGQVVIVGDSAHAIPPSGGQGANQALEDVYMLVLLMTATREKRVTWGDSLKWWQEVRQARVAKVIEFAGEIRRRRMPGWTGDGAASLDGDWLYGVDLAGIVEEWLQRI